jgi:hypothetical protein
MAIVHIFFVYVYVSIPKVRVFRVSTDKGFPCDIAL